MNLKLKAVLAAGTLLGAAYGFTGLAAAGPMAGIGQTAPSMQAAERSSAIDAPRIEEAYWRRGWHRGGWHRWHRWHRRW